MKKYLILFVALGLLFFDFASLDDITTGNHPDSLVEYLVLGMSVSLFVLACVLIYRNRKKLKSLGK